MPKSNSKKPKNVKPKSKQLKIQFPISRSAELIELRKLISEIKIKSSQKIEYQNQVLKNIIPSKINKKSINEINKQFNLFTVKIDGRPINIFLSFDFAKENFISILKKIAFKRKIFSSKELIKIELNELLKKVYNNRNINLKEKILIKFLHTLYKDHYNLNKKYKHFLELKAKFINNSLVSDKKKLREKRNELLLYNYNKKRISSQDSKEAQENIESIKKNYDDKIKDINKQIISQKKELKKIVEELKSEIPKLTTRYSILEDYNLADRIN